MLLFVLFVFILFSLPVMTLLESSPQATENYPEAKASSMSMR